VWIFITIVITKIAPVIIIPLFFKFEPLGDAALKERLIKLARSCGINILDVFKLKLSAKTKKANAALVGLGRTRRVLLGDTLLENYTKDEIEVVMAHELAHHKLLHIFKLILFGGLGTIIVFYLVYLTSGMIANTIGLVSISDIAGFPSVIFSISLFSVILLPAQNAFSRRLEVSADLFALKATGLPEAFISCMNKLAGQNLSDPSPSRFIEFALYDHPPISKRVKMAQDFLTVKK
ncbi:MAG: M48 family metalloprotease, partial [Candidatus Omnitrophota bacterium]